MAPVIMTSSLLLLTELEALHLDEGYYEKLRACLREDQGRSCVEFLWRLYVRIHVFLPQLLLSSPPIDTEML